MMDTALRQMITNMMTLLFKYQTAMRLLHQPQIHTQPLMTPSNHPQHHPQIYTARDMTRLGQREDTVLPQHRQPGDTALPPRTTKHLGEGEHLRDLRPQPCPGGASEANPSQPSSPSQLRCKTLDEA